MYCTQTSPEDSCSILSEAFQETVAEGRKSVERWNDKLDARKAFEAQTCCCGEGQHVSVTHNINFPCLSSKPLIRLDQHPAHFTAVCSGDSSWHYRGQKVESGDLNKLTAVSADKWVQTTIKDLYEESLWSYNTGFSFCFMNDCIGWYQLCVNPLQTASSSAVDVLHVHNLNSRCMTEPSTAAGNKS